MLLVEILTLAQATIRRSLAVGLATVLAGCGATPNPELARKFGQAIESFEAAKSPEDYLRTAAIYQEILDRGVESGAILYNQGNSYMRAGQRGRAIACYRRAEVYRPGDPQLQANLRLALGNAANGTPRPVLDYVFFWRGSIGYPGKLHATALLASITFGVGILAVFVSHSRIRRLAGGLLMVTLAMGGSAAADWFRYDQTRRGVVVDKEVVARKGNAVSYDPAFTLPLPEGTEFQLVERRVAWLHVRLHSGQQCWVPDSSVVTY